MKLLIRRTSPDDLNDIYDLHIKCFSQTDTWYKNNIKNYLDTGIVIVKDNILIGVLLQGDILPCSNNNNKPLSQNGSTGHDIKLFNINENEDYLENVNSINDIFKPITDNGIIFYNNNIHYKNIYGIVMICIHPKYRKKGLAQKLINKHFDDNINNLICLNTRASNNNAINLYKKMGYEHIGYIKNKYFLPDEDSAFMIKNIKNI
jgi:ribosomal protein S18 acetylase RimI-like enzyme